MACNLLACQSGPPVVVVSNLTINVARSLDSNPDEKEKLRQHLNEFLQDDNSISLQLATSGSGRGYTLQVMVGDALASIQDNKAYRPMELRLRSLNDGTEFTVSMRADGTEAWSADVFDAFKTAWKILRRERLLEGRNDQALIEALEDDNEKIRAFAISRLGERRSKAAVDPLCRVLTQEKESALVLNAIGSLAAIRDPRAVPALIELGHQKDPGFVLQVVYAIGAIGGRTAEAYLVTLASGHPSEVVQRGASEALQEMKRRSNPTNK